MSSSVADILFRPIRIGSLDLPNRIVMASISRYFAPEGIPADSVAAYYRRRAEGGVGLILSEGAAVDRPASRYDRDAPLFHGQAALAAWKDVIDAVHEAGGRMGPQLWHTGAGTSPTMTKWVPDAPVESPSGLLAPGTPRGVAMNEEAIAATIAAFAKAAADAKRLGFDTVELHGGHGYVIDEFFWAATNQRDDRYGGATIGERTRFAAEVVAAVRAAVGPGFPIILRISQWKAQDLTARLAQTPDQLAQWLQPLVEAGVDVLDCSHLRFWDPEFPEIDGEDGLSLAGWAKKLTGAATIAVGSVGLTGDFVAALGGERSAPAGLDRLAEKMQRDEFDLVAVGRALISDPQWAAKIRVGDTANLKGFDASHLDELT
jgi:2,4-dienoyl-CoA reductase-like NADH-dependent reductase (Old Yellow Enzyme family)